jgi:hypothetical protein
MAAWRALPWKDFDAPQLAKRAVRGRQRLKPIDTCLVPHRVNVGAK